MPAAVPSYASSIPSHLNNGPRPQAPVPIQNNTLPPQNIPFQPPAAPATPLKSVNETQDEDVPIALDENFDPEFADFYGSDSIFAELDDQSIQAGPNFNNSYASNYDLFRIHSRLTIYDVVTIRIQRLPNLCPYPSNQHTSTVNVPISQTVFPTTKSLHPSQPISSIRLPNLLSTLKAATIMSARAKVFPNLVLPILRPSLTIKTTNLEDPAQVRGVPLDQKLPSPNRDH